MVLGALALPLSLFPPLIWVTGPVSITAIILGVIGRRQRFHGGGASKAVGAFGIILGAVSLLIAVLFATCWWAYTHPEVEFHQEGTEQAGSLVPSSVR
ncbi:hypothetical protein [Actinomadura gamaensis]|uniref:DUF4190 domain-containing protein n=1 Tax=Actinomadura gamaensis TaxID=1763541 RepID=A0ABV9U9T6_9ACTN